MIKNDNSAVKKHHRSGFTLIELMVSIGIASLLMVLLFSSLKAINKASKQAQCASRLRQLGIAAMAYSNDNQGHLPTSAATNLGIHNYISPGLIELLSNYTGRDFQAFYCTDGLVRYETQAARPVLPVPNNPFHEIGYYWTLSKWFAFNFPVSVPKKVVALNTPKAALAMCLHFQGHRVHGNILNVLFADGHIERRATDPRGLLIPYLSSETLEFTREF